MEEGKESNILSALNFISKGGELLKRTRKGIHHAVLRLYLLNLVENKYANMIFVDVEMLITGALHWKQVSFSIDSCWQVKSRGSMRKSKEECHFLRLRKISISAFPIFGFLLILHPVLVLNTQDFG